MPRFPEAFKGSSIYGNYEGALEWLKEESISLDGIYDVALPKEAGKVYEAYSQGKPKCLTTIFNWTSV